MPYIGEYANSLNIEKLLESEFTKKYLKDCKLNKKYLEKNTAPLYQTRIPKSIKNIKNICSIDGGFMVVDVGRDARICFFRIAINEVNLEQLEELNKQVVVSPKKIQDLHKTIAYDFFLPFWNLEFKGTDVLEDILKNLIETYELSHILQYIYNKQDFLDEFVTDIKDTVGYNKKSRGGDLEKILGSLLTSLEQIFFLNFFHNKTEVHETLFLKDGPLNFIKSPVALKIKEYFRKKSQPFYYIGIEKSGKLVDYIKANKELLEKDTYISVDDNFLISELGYDEKTEGETYKTYYNSYYAWKVVINGTRDSYAVNIVLGTEDEETILDTLVSTIYPLLEKLYTSQYENALIPIVLANESASLSQKGKEFIEQKIKETLKTY